MPFSKLLFASILVLGLAACGGGTLDNYDVSLAGDGKNRKGVVFLSVNPPVNKCGGPAVKIGAQTTKGLEIVADNITAFVGPRSTKGVLRFELKPGKYEIVDVICYQGNSTVSMTAPKAKNSGLVNRRFSRGIAAFTVASGEVVNAGTLDMQKFGFSNAVSMKVIPMSPSSLAKIQKRFAKEYGRMTTRLMTVAGNQKSTEEMRKLECQLMESINQARTLKGRKGLDMSKCS
ncbi:MAG: hypothetical protein COA52_05805 [Hyphomicrobiales bacterium]|nr:MAG: hypothetical protein COA52_05805 [Hyphomicrobiales bacterium]